MPPEFGWDANTVEHGVVMDYASKTEIERREFSARIAFLSLQLH